VQQVIAGHEALRGFAVDACVHDEFCSRFFPTLLEQAKTLAPMVHHRTSVPVRTCYITPIAMTIVNLASTEGPDVGKVIWFVTDMIESCSLDPHGHRRFDLLTD
jgi:hypothetical protein